MKFETLLKTLLGLAALAMMAGCMVEDRPDTVVTPERKETVVVPDSKPDVVVTPPAGTTGN